MKTLALWTSRLRWPIGLASTAFILWTSVLPAMESLQTDFSNYYIPARLLARGESTTDLYDFSWFQRQMVYAGIEDQVGGFNRFPPAAGLVLYPLGGLEPLAAKRVWTLVNLGALAGLLVILQRLAGLPVYLGLALAAASGLALRNNFLFGQFYIVLAFLVAGALLLLRSGRQAGAGFLLGAATAVKLYPAPFVLAFALRREYRAIAGFAGGLVFMGALSVLAFGWENNVYFLFGILPRSLAGLTDNPFHPALQSWSGFLRRLLVGEPTLNPEPLLQSAFLFHFLRDALSLGLLSLILWAIRKRVDMAAWFVLVLGLLILSPTVLSYHGLLALIPVAFWLPRLWADKRAGLMAATLFLYILALSPVVYGWPEMHLRLWALLLLCGVFLWQMRPIGVPRLLLPAVFVVGLAHAVWASRQVPTDLSEPVAWGAPRSESPSAFSNDLVYSTLRDERYVLEGNIPPEAAAVKGHVFSPTFAARTGELFFEITEAGHSRIVSLLDGIMREWTPPELDCQSPSPSADGNRLAAACSETLYVFNAPKRGYALTSVAGAIADVSLSPDGARLAFSWQREGQWRVFEMDARSHGLRPLTEGRGVERQPRYSPGGELLVFSRRQSGNWSLVLLDLDSEKERPLTFGPGNDTHPAWGPQGRYVYFAGDRGRGIFMPAIYRIDTLGEI